MTGTWPGMARKSAFTPCSVRLPLRPPPNSQACSCRGRRAESGPDVQGCQIVIHLKAKKAQKDAEETVFLKFGLCCGGSFVFPADFPPSSCGGGA